MRAVFLLVCAALAHAQNVFVVEGIVTEPSGTPIAGAEVRLLGAGRESAASVFTSNSGTFEFRLNGPGGFRIEARKQGYISGYLSGGEGDSASRGVAVTAENPTARVSLTLTQNGSISGRVVDENGNSAAGLEVVAERIDVPARRPTPARTDESGQFSIQVPAGQFVVRLAGPQETNPTILTEFTSEDAEMVEQIEETTYWPGGVSDEQRVLPLTVPPGSVADAGTLRTRKVPHYRVRVAIAGCGGDASLSILGPSGPLRPETSSIPVPCGKEFLVTRLPAADYRFAISQRGNSSSWALAHVNPGRSNESVQVRMEPVTDIDGKFVPADGVTLDKAVQAQVMLKTDVPGFDARAAVREDGTFRLERVFWPSHRVQAFFPPGLFASEIRFNGQAAAGGVIWVTPGVPGKLEIAVDNRVATLTGDVQNAPDGETYVILAPEGATSVEGALGLMDAPIAGGRFRLEGVAPGEYRVVALLVDRMQAVFTDPIAFRRTVESGVPVALRRGETKDVSIRVLR